MIRIRGINSLINRWKSRNQLAVLDNYYSSPGLGFSKIEFPIIIKDGVDLMLVENLDDFFNDCDLYFHKFDYSMRLIDSAGKQFTWGYNQLKRTNFPDKFEKYLTLKDVQDLFDNYFSRAKKKPEYQEVNNIDELLEKVKDYF